MSRRQRNLILIGALLLILILSAAYFLTREGDRETATVQRGTLSVSVETVGTLEASDPIMLRSDVDGVVLSLGASSGDSVSQGDIVVMLDPEPLRDLAESAKSQLERAEFNLQAIEAQTPPEQVGESAALIDARAQVQAARDALDAAEAAIADAAILAPADATVLETLVDGGEPVSAGQVVARLLQPGDLELVAQLSEIDLPAVEPGTQVSFRLDAFPSTEIAGTVEQISPQATVQAGATTFPTTIRFDAPEDVDLRPGMNAEVTFITEELEDVLLIPESAVRAVGERTYVTVVRDGDEQEVEVILGQRSNGMAEVISGLEAGEEVVLP